MIRRALLVWCVILALAIANGAMREGVLVPRIGLAVGHVVSVFTLSIAALLVSYFTIGWMAPAHAVDAWRLGFVWLALTLAFEFLAGHYLFGASWATLLADYDLWRGRLWVLVPATTAAAPWLVWRLRVGGRQ